MSYDYMFGLCMATLMTVRALVPRLKSHKHIIDQPAYARNLTSIHHLLPFPLPKPSHFIAIITITCIEHGAWNRAFCLWDAGRQQQGGGGGSGAADSWNLWRAAAAAAAALSRGCAFPLQHLRVGHRRTHSSYLQPWLSCLCSLQNCRPLDSAIWVVATSDAKLMWRELHGRQGGTTTYSANNSATATATDDSAANSAPGSASPLYRWYLFCCCCCCHRFPILAEELWFFMLWHGLLQTLFGRYCQTIALYLSIASLSLIPF